MKKNVEKHIKEGVKQTLHALLAPWVALAAIIPLLIISIVGIFAIPSWVMIWEFFLERFLIVSILGGLPYFLHNAAPHFLHAHNLHNNGKSDLETLKFLGQVLGAVAFLIIAGIFLSTLFDPASLVCRELIPQSNTTNIFGVC